MVLPWDCAGVAWLLSGLLTLAIEFFCGVTNKWILKPYISWGSPLAGSAKGRKLLLFSAAWISLAARARFYPRAMPGRKVILNLLVIWAANGGSSKLCHFPVTSAY